MEIIQPFSNDFLCPNCNFLDKGAFCSNCGKELLIENELYGITLKNRLLNLSYETFERWEESFSHIFTNYSFDEWRVLPANIVCKTEDGQNGLKINFIIISSDSTFQEQLEKVVNNQFNKISEDILTHNKINKKERSKNINDYIETFSIHYISINHNENFDNKSHSFSWTKKILTKTGSGGVKWGLFSAGYIENQLQSFNLIIRCEKSVIDTKTLTILSESKGVYDLVYHQLKVVLEQSVKKPLINKSNDSKNIILVILYSLVEGFIEYFKILFQYFKNPTLFSQIISKNYISVGKILNLYGIGLACSVTIPTIITFGQLNGSNLTSFSDLPPFISDIAELALEFFQMITVAFFIHIIAYFKKKQGKFVTLLLGLIFMKSFLQLFERPYDLFIDKLSVNMNFDNPNNSYKVIELFGNLGFLVYAHFLFPLTNAIYKLNRGATATGWGLGYLTIFIFAMLVTKQIPFTPEYNVKQKYLVILEDEKKIVSEYKDKFLPNYYSGNNTGDYKIAIEEIVRINNNLQKVLNDCNELNSEIINKFPKNIKIIKFSNSMSDMLSSRLKIYTELENLVKTGKFNSNTDSLNKILHIKIKEVDENYIGL